MQCFYKGESLDHAETELNQFIAGEGSWGRYVSDLHEKSKLPFETTSDSCEKGFYIESVMTARALTISSHPDLLWKNTFQCEFPLLYEVARCFLVMSTQSADVECLCKAHKLIHTSMRNWLKNTTVLQLIYCYINLRLLNEQDNHGDQCDSNADDQVALFLEQAIHDHQT